MNITFDEPVYVKARDVYSPSHQFIPIYVDGEPGGALYIRTLHVPETYMCEVVATYVLQAADNETLRAELTATVNESSFERMQKSIEHWIEYAKEIACEDLRGEITGPDAVGSLKRYKQTEDGEFILVGEVP